MGWNPSTSFAGLPASNTSAESICEGSGSCTRMPSIDGILVQLPLPSQIDSALVFDAGSPAKDVDGFHPINVGRLYLGQEGDVLTPCTPTGIIELLERNHITIAGARAVVIGRSAIVGKPMASLLINRHAT